MLGVGGMGGALKSAAPVGGHGVRNILKQQAVPECVEHFFHDVSAMPDPIPGTACQFSIVLCV